MKTRIIGAILAIVLAIGAGVAIWFYVRGADQRAAEGAEFVPVLVATQEIPTGTPAAAIGDLVELTELPALAVADGAVSDIAEIEGLVANGTVLVGEQILEDRFVDPASAGLEGGVAVPDGFQEVTVALSPDRVVGGVVRPGATVGVVITSNADVPNPGYVTKFTLHKVLVTRVQEGATITPEGAEEQTGPVDAVMITLALQTRDVERVVWAAEGYEDNLAGIWLTLEPDSASVDGSITTDQGNVFQ